MSVELEKLFEVSSGDNVPPGATVTITVMAMNRCVPATVVMAYVTMLSFAIREIYCGVEPLLTLHRDVPMALVAQDPDRKIKSVVCEVGMDFSVKVANVSAKPLPFIAEIFGSTGTLGGGDMLLDPHGNPNFYEVAGTAVTERAASRTLEQWVARQEELLTTIDELCAARDALEELHKGVDATAAWSGYEQQNPGLVTPAHRRNVEEAFRSGFAAGRKS